MKSLLFVMCATLALVSLQSTSLADEDVYVKQLGDVGPGPYEIQNAHKLLFIVANAYHIHDKARDYEKAFDLAVKEWISKNQSARTTTKSNDNQESKKPYTPYYILGVKDLTNGDYFWVGVDVFKNDACKTLDSNGEGLKSGKFHHYRVTFQGRKIVFCIADNDKGGLLWRFDDN